MRIKILYPEWYSLKKLAGWVAEEFKRKGYEVIVETNGVNAVKRANEVMLLITGGLQESKFMRLCGQYNKVGHFWVDILQDRSPIQYKAFQGGMRRNGGKFISTTQIERKRLEAGGVIVDAVIPRCIPDVAFDYQWNGKNKTVMTIGNPDFRSEASVFRWADIPVELKKATRKGHEYLVKFAENNPDWKVCLVSHKGQLEKIQDVSEISNLEILETGTLAEKDLYTLLSNTGVYCHPARIEPFGMAIVEAEAMGVPTCFTGLVQQKDIGGGIEIPYRDTVKFPGGVILALIDYKEVEKAIFETYARSEELSQRGKENAKRFKTSVIVDRLLKVMGI